jgi:hypothetical protein
VAALEAAFVQTSAGPHSAMRQQTIAIRKAAVRQRVLTVFDDRALEEFNGLAEAVLPGDGRFPAGAAVAFRLRAGKPRDGRLRVAPLCVVVAAIGRAQERVPSLQRSNDKPIVEAHVVAKALVFKCQHGAL